MMPFEKAVEFVLRHEGGYVNDLRDPGGETNFGISKRSYPALDIKGLTRAEAIHIYERDYWRRLRCDQLPSPLALLTFDCAINQGPSTAAYVLQEALGVKQDGIIGTVTLMTARKANLKETVAALAAARCWRYSTNKNVARFGKGWFRRAAECLITAMEPL